MIAFKNKMLFRINKSKGAFFTKVLLLHFLPHFTLFIMNPYIVVLCIRQYVTNGSGYQY